MQCRPQGCVKCMAPIDRGMTMWVCMCRSWVQAIFECGRHDRDMCAQDRCRGGGHVCVVHGAMVQGSGVRTVQGIDTYRHGALCRHAQVVCAGCAKPKPSLSLSLSLSQYSLTLLGAPQATFSRFIAPEK